MAEEAPALGTEELKALENWSHLQPIILKAGRCTQKAPPGLSEEELEAWTAKMAEEDPPVERFKSI